VLSNTMQIFEKPLHEFKEEELQQKVNHTNPTFGALAQYELQRRQQEKNTSHISELVEEIRELKDITEKNAEISKKNADSDNRLARVAIGVAVVSFLTQFAFSIHHKLECRYVFRDDNTKSMQHSGCYRTVDLGILGTPVLKVKDFNTPLPE
jgi:hypothetical protein